MGSTREQVVSAASAKFKTAVHDMGGGVKITFHELKRKDKDALNARLWKRKPDGQFEQDEKGFLVPLPDCHFNEEWIAACADPALTVDDLLTDEWPDSLKTELRLEAQKVNGITLEDAAKK